MKKKIGIWSFLLVGLSLLLVACGEKSKESVMETLEKNVTQMDGYYAEAEMSMNVGQDEQTYEINIRHQKDDFYRVDLINHHSEHGDQVIIKNEDGVFVLTPELNKKFKFQTEWPHHSSQPYLYESLVDDILKDEEAVFEATDSYYVFSTRTNYKNNNNLPYQEIYFDQKNYTPVYVKIMDIDHNVLIEVHFSEFELNPSFAKNEFDVDEILDQKSLATVHQPDEEEENEDEEKDHEEVDESFPILFPLFTAGAELAVKKTVKLENGERVLMTFTGDKNFTLIQEKMDSIPSAVYPKVVRGDIVHLGFTVGALTETSVEWSYEGVDFYLASDTLSKEELIQVAQSVQGREAK